MATPVETSHSTLLQTVNVPEFVPSAESWHIWKEKLEIHFAEINCTMESTKKAILLKSVGTTAYTILHSLCSPNTPVSKTLKELYEIMEIHFTPPTIVFRERKSFYDAVRQGDDSVATWFAKIKQLALNCKFGNNLNAFVLDKFVTGLPERIFEKLCEEKEDLTLSEALRKAMIFETKFSSNSMLQSSVNFVKRNNNNKHNRSNSSTKQNDCEKVKNVNRGEKKQCTHCGWRNHDSKNCKFKDSTCNTCSKKGHISTVCRSKKQFNFISNYEVSKNDSNAFDFSICSVTAVSSSDLYTLEVEISGKLMTIACDTGSPCTIIPVSLYRILPNKEKLKSTISYFDYNGKRINLVGEYNATFMYRGLKKNVTVVVSNTENFPLLGRTFLRAYNFDLVQKLNFIDCDKKEKNNFQNFEVIVEQIKNEFYDVFDGKLGAYKFSKIALPIEVDSKPIFCKPRPLPFAWKEKIEKQLHSLIENDVLEPVNNSDWGTPLVPILKPCGDIRICGDYKVTLNKFLCNFKYPLPRIDEIFAQLEGGELFTKLDMSNAYNQLILDEKSQLLCTWSTHIGTLKMKRLPFGVKPAAAIFQKTMETLLKGIPGVVVYQDDITVTGKKFSQHIQTLKLVLNKLKLAGLKLNSGKCAFFQSEITYLGFKIDKFGLSKRHDRVEPILKAPIPKDIHELKAFVGMINYYSRFIDKFSEKMVPLYKLMQKNVPFVWSKECHEVYELMKREVTSDQVLVHFNPELPIILTTDACNSAIAGVLSHKFKNGLIKPISFVSRALTKSELNYSTLEKEALAIIYSVTKLKQYLLGQHFVLQTDHKPLLTIFGEHKGLPIMAAARMQRWAFILSGFNYSIEYVKGEINDADNLSRIPQVSMHIDNNSENSYINFIQKDNFLHLNFKHVAIETRRDPILSKLLVSIQNGTVKNLTGSEYDAFRKRSLELTVEYDCILWGYRTIIPQKLRKLVLEELHLSHLGIVKTKTLARSYVWWPNIDSDIEQLVKNCLPCQELQASPEKSSLISWKSTGKVWGRIHVDFAGPLGDSYFLVVIDSFTKWAEAFQTKVITSAFTIKKLNELFSRYGSSDVLVSDNGTQFTSQEFKIFTDRNGVRHILTAPGHPATNGQAENFVKTLKKSLIASLKKCKTCNIETNLNRFLSDYRNTKHITTGETPAKLFLGRQVKTRFSLLRPPLAIERIAERQLQSELNHKGKREASFESGQKVFVRDYRNPNKHSWSLARIKNKLGPRSYCCILINNNNRQIKRHLDQIRAAGVVQNTNATDDSGIVESGATLSTANDSLNEAVSMSSAGATQDSAVSDVQEIQSNSNNVRSLRPRVEGRVVKINDNRLPVLDFD